MVELSSDEAAIVALVRDFVDAEVMPVVRDLEHSNTYPEKLIDQMKQLGVFGLAIPEPYGDAAVSTVCYAMVTEELARGWMSLAGAMGGHTVVAKLILAFGTEQQRLRYLPKMASGELRATMALTEPSGGSDLANLRTSAVRDGDEWVINGAKTWISNARHAGLAALLCRTDPEASPPHKGISILLVEKVPGFTIGKDLPKLGYKGVESCELFFDDCRVPADALLGGTEGLGFSQMMKGLEVGRIQVAARATRHRANPSGDTSRWATCWLIWPRNTAQPASCCCTPRAPWTPASEAISKLAWQSSLHRRPRCRSASTRSGCTAATATRPSSMSSGTSGTHR